MNTKASWERGNKRTGDFVEIIAYGIAQSDLKVLKLDHGKWTQVIMPLLLQPLIFIEVAGIE